MPTGDIVGQDEDGIRIDEQLKVTVHDRDQPPPIFSLPPELLSNIFLYVNTLSTGVRSNSNPQCVENMTWREFITITHVCHTWRSIALDCPALWSSIIFSSIAIAEEMLARSKSSPLIVRMPNTFMLPDSVDAVLPTEDFLAKLVDVERLQELHVSLSHQQLDDILRILVNGSRGCTARHLQSIFIHYNDYRWNVEFILPPKLLSIPMPRLRHLNIKDCTMQWDLLHSCVSEELLSLKLDHVSRPPRKLFFDLLSLIPNIKTLRLTVSFYQLSKDDDNDDRIIKLPKLTICSIEGASVAECLDFHTHVVYPLHKAQLRMFPFTDELPTFTNVGLVCAPVESCRLDKYTCQTSHASLMVRVWRQLDEVSSIIVWNTPLRPFPERPMETSLFDNPFISMDLRAVMIGREQCPSLLDMISMPGLKTLSVFVITEKSSAEGWSKFFRRHRGITHLSIHSDTAQEIFYALTMAADDSFVVEPPKEFIDDSASALPTPSIPCLPQLTDMTLCDHGKNLLREKYDTEFSRMLDCLKQRHESGFPIRNLNMVDCYWFNTESVDMLRAVVEDVRWDGKYQDDQRWEESDSDEASVSDSEWEFEDSEYSVDRDSD